MAKRHKKYQEKEEIRYPELPDGLIAVASKNQAFAERLIGVIRIAMAKTGGKHGRR